MHTRQRSDVRDRRSTRKAFPVIFLMISLLTILWHVSAFSQQIADSVKWRIYFTAVDSANPSGKAYAKAGFHPDGHYAMPYDTVYGFGDRWRENAAQGDTERDWPPPPPVEDIRFNNIRSPLNSNQYSLIHPFTDSTLVDTMKMIWQDQYGAGVSTSGHLLRWTPPAVLRYYVDSIFLRLQNFYGVWLNLNLLQDSMFSPNPLKDTIQDGSLIPTNNLRLIIYHPRRAPRAPDSVTTISPPGGALNVISPDTLVWGAIGSLPGMTPYYRVQLASDRTFKPGSIILQDSIPGSTRQFSVPAVGWYYWRVKVFTPFGIGIYKALPDSFYVTTIVNGVGDEINLRPSSLALYQNYPNPFNPSTTIRYDVAVRTNVRIEIFDLLGQSVKLLVNEVKSPGSYRISWEPEHAPSGLYYYRITAGAHSDVKKMLLLR